MNESLRTFEKVLVIRKEFELALKTTAGKCCQSLSRNSMKPEKGCSTLNQGPIFISTFANVQSENTGFLLHLST